MHAPSEDSRPVPASLSPGRGMVPRSSANRSTGSVVSRRGRVSRMARGWPSSHSSNSPNDRCALRGCAAGQAASRTSAYSTASLLVRPPTSILRIGPSQFSRVRLVITTALLPWAASCARKSQISAQSGPPSGGATSPGSGICRTDSKLSHSKSIRCSIRAFCTQVRRVWASSSSNWEPCSARPISVITPSRPDDTTPGSNECQNTQSGRSTPPVSRHQRPNALASSVFPIPP